MKVPEHQDKDSLPRSILTWGLPAPPWAGSQDSLFFPSLLSLSEKVVEAQILTSSVSSGFCSQCQC